MTTLQNFLDYRTNCPLCKGTLVLELTLNTWTPQLVALEAERAIGTFSITGYPMSSRRTDFQIEVHYDLTSNDFYLSPYFSESQSSVDLEKFQSFRKKSQAINAINFHRTCGSCVAYRYSSKSFDLDLKKAQYSEIPVFYENAILVKEKKEYRAINFVSRKESVIEITPRKMQRGIRSRNFSYDPLDCPLRFQRLLDVEQLPNQLDDFDTCSLFA
jgi:hypothetical protein